MQKQLVISIYGLLTFSFLLVGCHEQKCFECNEATFQVSYHNYCSETWYHSEVYDFETELERQLAIDSMQALFEDTCQSVYFYEILTTHLGAPKVVCNDRIGWKDRISELESQGEFCKEE